MPEKKKIRSSEKIVDMAGERLRSCVYNMQLAFQKSPKDKAFKQQLKALKAEIKQSFLIYYIESSYGTVGVTVLRGELSIANRALHRAELAYKHANPKPNIFERLANWLSGLIFGKKKADHMTKILKPEPNKQSSQPVGNNPLILTSSMARILASSVGKCTQPEPIAQPIPVLASQDSYKALQPNPPLESFADLKM